MAAINDVLSKAKENNVKFIRLQFTNIFGVLKNVAVTVEDLPQILEEGMIFDGMALEGSVRHRETDIVFCPHPDTFVIFPWRPREGAVARLICDAHTPDRKPFNGCSRYVLKKVMAEAAELGFTMRAGCEV